MQKGLKLVTPVILASASPRRQELIHKVFETVSIKVSTVDETVSKTVPAAEVPILLAQRKAVSVAKLAPELPVIGCDTLVIDKERILSKPKDEVDAIRILHELSGHTHLVVTGCAIAYRNIIHSFSEVTEVEFYPLADSDIEEYVKSGEPIDKAGAYGIQGAGSLFVKQIRGDYYNVVGLPIARLRREFLEFRRSYT